MLLDTIEQWIQGIGAIAGLATLAIALIAMFKSLRQPAGREEPGARFALRTPVLLLVTSIFLGMGVLLWQPLPLHLPVWLRVMLLSVGGWLFFAGLSLYLWGLQALGQMFGPSSGFGVRLHLAHRLITKGPYAHIRHPMYLAVMGAAVGGFCIYRTWAMLCFAICMFGVILRARREEKVLAAEFGPVWVAYAARVPAWLPRLSVKKTDA